MTIEIKQLVIRAVAEGGREPARTHDPFVPPIMPTPIRSEPHPVDLAEQREAIVAACVRVVMRKLERSRER
ncbi:DUF5908 family protein [Nannocystaceae bacterium ST9]